MMKTTCAIGLPGLGRAARCKLFIGKVGGVGCDEHPATASAATSKAPLVITDDPQRFTMRLRLPVEMHPVRRRFVALDLLEGSRGLAVIESCGIVCRIVRARVALRKLRQTEVVFYKSKDARGFVLDVRYGTLLGIRRNDDQRHAEA